MLIIVQRGATKSSIFIILPVHSICFGCQSHPISSVHKTVTTAFSTGDIFCAATSLQSGHHQEYTELYLQPPVLEILFVQLIPSNVVKPSQAWPRWREVTAQKIWPVPEAVVTVLYTLNIGCDWHPKHVKWTGRIIIRLLCVASRGQAKTSLATLEGGSCTKIWLVPEAVATVLCTPDDVCGWHPKHVEWTCRTINRLLCVAYLCNY